MKAIKRAATGTPDGPQTYDGQTLQLVPTPRRKPQLTSLEGVRCEIARVYRDMESGKRESQEGSRLVYVLGQIGRVLELTQIETRLIQLEEQAGAKLLSHSRNGQ